MPLRKTCLFLFSSLGMLLLILDSHTALQSAAAGISSCIHSVIPALFPFLFCSGILTDSLWGSRIPLAPRLRKRLGIPEGAEGLLIPGFLGGYPAGAQAVAKAYGDKRLDKSTAHHFLRFSSNAGPAFLFGILGSAFSHQGKLWLLWMIHILSALAAGSLDKPASTTKTYLSSVKISLSAQLAAAVKVMGVICGWVVLFRIVLGFLDRWLLWLLPEPARTLVWGLLELSNGCLRLGNIRNESLRFICCSVMLSAGGVCVMMQTASVIQDLSILPYLKGKLLQTLFSFILSLLASGGLWFPFAGICLWILFSPVKKEVAFPVFSVYNADSYSGRFKKCCSAKKSSVPAPTVSMAPGWRMVRSSASKKDSFRKMENASGSGMIPASESQ